MGSLAGGSIGGGEGSVSKPCFANGSNKHQLIVGNVGAIGAWPSANCESKALLPAFPLPLKLRDRMAVIYSVLSLSIAAR